MMEGAPVVKSCLSVPLGLQKNLLYGGPIPANAGQCSPMLVRSSWTWPGSGSGSARACLSLPFLTSHSLTLSSLSPSHITHHMHAPAPAIRHSSPSTHRAPKPSLEPFPFLEGSLSSVFNTPPLTEYYLTFNHFHHLIAVLAYRSRLLVACAYDEEMHLSFVASPSRIGHQSSRRENNQLHIHSSRLLIWNLELQHILHRRQSTEYSHSMRHACSRTTKYAAESCTSNTSIHRSKEQNCKRMHARQASKQSHTTTSACLHGSY